jgi:hypothetical protein
MSAAHSNAHSTSFNHNGVFFVTSGHHKALSNAHFPAIHSHIASASLVNSFVHL